MAFILDESFTTGSRPASWYSGSSGDFAYATAPAPLEGTYSLRMTTSDGQASFFNGSAITGNNYGHFMFLIEDIPSSYIEFMTIQDATTGVAFYIHVLSDGTVQIGDANGAAVATASSISADTVYHVFWRYKPGSGANAEREIWINTTNDRPGTAAGLHASNSTGTLTNGLQYHNFLGTAGVGHGPFIVDTVQWANTDEWAGGGGSTAVPVFMNQYRQRRA